MNPLLKDNRIKAAALGGGALCGFFALIPAVLYGVFHTGVLALAGLAALLIAFGLARPGWPLRLRRGLAVLLALVLAGSVLLSLPMLGQAYLPPPADEGPQVVLVLGGKIHGDRPSLMLSYRLQAAAAQLRKNPQAVCVVSGGQGADEEYPEARVMQHYLAQLGIAPQRIYTEAASRNTRQNLSLSVEVMLQNNLQGQVVIVTDAFHQLRASLYARQSGVQSRSLSSKTPWGLAPSYWVREFFALGKLALELMLKQPAPL